jgi:hypothetical protein
VIVRKDYTLLREFRVMYTLGLGKIINLTTENRTWLYSGDLAVLRGRDYTEETWLYLGD